MSQISPMMHFELRKKVCVNPINFLGFFVGSFIFHLHAIMRNPSGKMYRSCNRSSKSQD